jgi:putative ATP-dependent endonuclease of the OLD family
MKISGLQIKNFGCFDENGCVVKIDNIVVLIGQNNKGKSTILDAYEAYASAGSELPISCFHNKKSDLQIEITGYNRAGGR